MRTDKDIDFSVGQLFQNTVLYPLPYVPGLGIPPYKAYPPDVS